VPDDQLFALPFAALRDADGRHLVERHTIRVSPSIGVLRQLGATRDTRSSEAAAATQEAVVVGDPSFASGGGLAQLPGARAEASEVARILRSSFGGIAATSVLELGGGAATRDDVTAAMTRGARVLHLATHGSADGLYLANDTAERPSLSTTCVYQLRLRTDLAVLSACDTFRGKLSTDGVVGIARAFLAAGASSLGVSLWKVDDRATKELMVLFYEQYTGVTTNGGGGGRCRGARATAQQRKEQRVTPHSRCGAPCAK
jgi:CHAT domain-containing protein